MSQYDSYGAADAAVGTETVLHTQVGKSNLVLSTFAAIRTYVLGIGGAITGALIDLGANAVQGGKAKQTVVAGTTYTVLSTDLGRVLVFTNGSAVAVTVPNLGADFICGWAQKGAGQVTFTADSGVTGVNRQSQGKSAGQWAMGTLWFDAANHYVLSGDTGA